MFVVTPTSLDYWQRFRLGMVSRSLGLDPSSDVPVALQAAPSLPGLASGAPSDVEVLDHLEDGLFGLEPPVHLAVTAGDDRRASRLKQCHLMAPSLPSDGFVRVRPGLFVATPELTFAQLAGRLDLVELLRVAYCLCGRFVPVTGRGAALRAAHPVTNAGLLLSFLSRNSHLHGCANAMRAMEFVRDSSASPMETALGLLLCLPRRLGGYGFAFPRINAIVEPRADERPRVGQLWYECDLLWAEPRVDVEYDGEAYHTGIDRIARDAARRNDLEHLGYTVLTLTKRQLFDREEFERFAEQLAKAVGVMLRHREGGGRWRLRHDETRRGLLVEPRFGGVESVTLSA